MTFAPGETVVVQELWRGRLWAARPMRVVEDDGELAVLWTQRDAVWMRPSPPPGRAAEDERGERLATSLLREDWVLTAAPWHTHTLQFWRAGEWRSVWVSWLPEGEHWGWYVNLQLPHERWERGFRTMDLALDVIVDPDWTWHLKDEDELEVFERRGVFDADLVARIRAEARRAIADAEARCGLFGERWQDWRPERDWPLPELPAGWDAC